MYLGFPQTSQLPDEGCSLVDSTQRASVPWHDCFSLPVHCAFGPSLKEPEMSVASRYVAFSDAISNVSLDSVFSCLPIQEGVSKAMEAFTQCVGY